MRHSDNENNEKATNMRVFFVKILLTVYFGTAYDKYYVTLYI